MTYRESYTIEKHAQLLLISAFFSLYEEFNINWNFNMKNYTPLDGLRWSRDSDSALNNMPQTDVLGRAGGGKKLTKCFFHWVMSKNLKKEQKKQACQNNKVLTRPFFILL